MLTSCHLHREEEDEEEDEDDDLSLGDAIRLAQEEHESIVQVCPPGPPEIDYMQSSSSADVEGQRQYSQCRTIQPGSYFSDEDASD